MKETRFFCTREGTEVSIASSTTIESTDKRVECFFINPFPDDKEIVFSDKGLPVLKDKAKIETFQFEKRKKKNDLSKKFAEVEIEKVEHNNIFWHGGFESELKLDGAKRRAETAGLEKVVFFDVKNMPHQLTISEATDIVVLIGAKNEEDFAKYQGLKVKIENATTATQLNKIGW